MIISDEQAHLAAEYLHAKPAATAPCRVERRTGAISAELLLRVRDELNCLPDTRGERVKTARLRVSRGVRGDEVAGKIIGRIISDSLR